MNRPLLNPAKLDQLGVLLPMAQAYHRQEGIAVEEKRLRAALSALITDARLGRIWMIEWQGSLVGYIALCFGYSIEFAGRDAFVDEFFIEAPFRGQGIGRAALQQALEAARRLHVQAVHLEVAGDNDRAQALYRSLGFKVRARFDMLSLRIG